MRAEPRRDGVTFGFDPAAREFNYLAGYPVEPSFWAPTGISLIHIPLQNYAAFATTLPGLMDTLHQANHVWLPASPHRRADGPEVELYNEAFDPQDPASPMYFYLPILPR
jgi:AraC family transcriptional regulator